MTDKQIEILKAKQVKDIETLKAKQVKETDTLKAKAAKEVAGLQATLAKTKENASAKATQVIAVVSELKGLLGTSVLTPKVNKTYESKVTKINNLLNSLQIKAE